MINDLKAVHVNAPQAKLDTDNLASAVENHGKKSSAAQGARQTLINDFINAGVDPNPRRGSSMVSLGSSAR